MDYNTNSLKQGRNYCEIYVEAIHWFEFCMTHLFTKVIVEQYGYMSISDAMSNGYYTIYSNHPIDYLYKEFKKLNK